jgi:glutathionyl-hydroquinone reductase
VFSTRKLTIIIVQIIPLILRIPANEEKVKQIEQAFEYLDQFVEGENYVAGKSITVADIVLLTSVSNFSVIRSITIKNNIIS